MRLTLLAVALVLVANEAAAQAVLQGSVKAADSTRIAGARVQVVEPTSNQAYTAITDSTGNFRIRLAHPVRPGLFNVRVEMLGYRTLDVPVQIGEREEITVQLTMAVAAIAIEPLRVSARGRYNRGPLDDYLDRADRVKRFGGGTILDYNELQRRPHMNAAMLMSEHLPARNCPPTFFLDGMRVPPEELRTVQVSGLEGIEIYRTQTLVPAQYQGRSTCGVVLLWTALDDHGKGSPITWRRVFMALGLLTLGVLLLR